MLVSSSVVHIRDRIWQVVLVNLLGSFSRLSHRYLFFMLKAVVFRHCRINSTDNAPFYILKVISVCFIVGIVIGADIQ